MLLRRIILLPKVLAEAGLNWVKRNLLHRGGDQSPVHIMPYLGYGTEKMVNLKGRVIQNHRVQRARIDDSRWRNLLNILRRFENDEIPFATLTAEIDGHIHHITTNDEGYFNARLRVEGTRPPQSIWKTVQLHYEDERRVARTQGQVLIPPQNAQYGVISDLDDTVIYTGVTHLLRFLSNVFLKNAHTRLPFAGVAEFYQALQRGSDGEHFNPIFYVSNSPWNLYDLMLEFFQIRGIPRGPIFLRDFGLTTRYFRASGKHKYEAIERLLTLYEDLPFILIGDSGEKDAAIYLQIARAYPNRIVAVYIRDVYPQRQDTKHHRRVQEAAERIEETGCEMLLIPDTMAAAQHAVARGFISADSLPKIQQAVEEDTPNNPLQRLIQP